VWVPDLAWFMREEERETFRMQRRPATLLVAIGAVAGGSDGPEACEVETLELEEVVCLARRNSEFVVRVGGGLGQEHRSGAGNGLWLSGGELQRCG